MTKLYRFFTGTALLLLLSILPSFMTSCSDDVEVVRSQDDILGPWTDDEGNYTFFDATQAYKFVPFTDFNGIERVRIDQEGCLYEPGYNFLINLTMESEPDIYQVTELTASDMTWVWADNLMDDKYDGMSQSEILGSIITQAHDGFTLDYSRTIHFRRATEEAFNAYLEENSLRDYFESLFPSDDEEEEDWE